MEPSELLATVADHARAAADAGRSAGLETPVASCPGWNIRDLLRHLGSIHRWAEAIVSEGSLTAKTRVEHTPADTDVFSWLVDGADTLVARCGERGSGAPAWNWTDEVPTVAFWMRRMAHETSVHAWDAASSAGLAGYIEPALAADGIDELLTVIWARRRPRGLSGTLHLHCTDAPGEWTVDLPTFSITRGHTKGDAALRGTASELLLRILNRGDGGEVFGDPSILASWRESVRF